MKKQVYAVSMLTTAMLLAACDGKDGAPGLNGQDGADGNDGFNTLIATRDLPVGDADCLGGGLALDSGLDTNRNDILDAEEVTATEFLECAVTPTLRALHASPDAPPVNVVIDGTEALSGVDYAQGSGFVGVGQAANVTETGADVNVTVNAVLPGGEAEAINADLALAFGTETTVIATGTVAGDGLPLPVVPVTNPIGEAIAAGSFRAQVVHGAPGAPDVDVYVTAFDADLDASAPINGSVPFAYQDVSGRLEVPAGDYQIRITPAGATDPVVYDSGEVSLAAGADLMIVAIDNVRLGDSAVQLVVLDGTAASTLYDTNTPAAALAVHLSPDAPAVDILANIDSTPEDEALKLAENVNFTDFCVIEGIPAPVDFTISVAASADNTVVPLTFPLASTVDGAVAAIVSGFLSSGEPAIQLTPDTGLVVDTRSVATEAKIRLTHASPSTGNVDIYLLPAGGDIDAATPDFADVPFAGTTGVLSIAPATYDVYVTGTGSKIPAISATGIPLTGGEIWEIIARDPMMDGSEGMAPLPLIVDYETAPTCVVAP